MSGVLGILRARLLRGSRAPHGDGASIALAVEGGAMRGVVSAGMVWALEDLGYTHAFDAVYGSSAGAINSAYFLAGQAAVGTTIYYEDINNRSFINLSRPLRGRPIVNLGFLLDDVARNRKRLDVDRVLQSRTPLSVLATDIHTTAIGRVRRVLRRQTSARLAPRRRDDADCRRWPVSSCRSPFPRRVSERTDPPADRRSGRSYARRRALDAKRRHA